MTTVEHLGNPEAQHHNLIKMQQPETAKNIHVFVNGDRYFAGRKFVLNRKHIPDFNGFLHQVTMGIKPSFGAVRNIYTPNAGHRVNDLREIQNGMDLVAGGVGRFCKLEYREIGHKKRPGPRRNLIDFKHHHNRMNVSARWRKYVKDPCQIYVYGNGDTRAPAMRLLLIPRCMKTWDLVLGEITEKISLRTGQAVRKLYDMNFKLLLDPSELENGQYYVAVGSEKLKKFPYGDYQIQNKLSPRKHNQPLPPIRRPYKPKPPPKEESEQTYTKMHAHKKQLKEQEETTVMGASAATGYRPLRTKHYKPQRPSGTSPSQAGEDSVFHAKPVKVKRSGGKAPQANQEIHPPTAHEADGVFRTETDEIKAEEIQENEDTKVDLPIDQVHADTVEDEEIIVGRFKENFATDDNIQEVEVNYTEDNTEESRDLQPVTEDNTASSPIHALEAPVPAGAPVFQPEEGRSSEEEDPAKTPSSPTPDVEDAENRLESTLSVSLTPAEETGNNTPSPTNDDDVVSEPAEKEMTSARTDMTTDSEITQPIKEDDNNSDKKEDKVKVSDDPEEGGARKFDEEEIEYEVNDIDDDESLQRGNTPDQSSSPRTAQSQLEKKPDKPSFDTPDNADAEEVGTLLADTSVTTAYVDVDSRSEVASPNNVDDQHVEDDIPQKQHAEEANQHDKASPYPSTQSYDRNEDDVDKLHDQTMNDMDEPETKVFTREENKDDRDLFAPAETELSNNRSDADGANVAISDASPMAENNFTPEPKPRKNSESKDQDTDDEGATAEFVTTRPASEDLTVDGDHEKLGKSISKENLPNGSVADVNKTQS
ncbi:uncharacterized protein LOC143456004 isoform X1 [Clavelina lepadiformis]|uniref:uncharacterized protein LOC143456004 isoform X1 n=2 Tax=Clavelina lepadiformis TaxID=159417 RepID=UPI0040415BDA